MSITTWTVYDHPDDFPDCYVARRFEGEEPTEEIIVSAELMPLRGLLAGKGLAPVRRSPEDDPVIVETWL